MPSSSDAFPSLIYKDTVLGYNFRDMQRLFIAPLFVVHEAHGVMLCEQGILSRDEFSKIWRGLQRFDLRALQDADYDGSVEDFFFYIERQLQQMIGPEVAGKLHTARSRNDIDITIYRLRLRQELLKIHQAVAHLVTIGLDLAQQHRQSIMPGYTHTQPAQPTTLAHYLCAVMEALSRDLGRLQHAFATTNLNPLGACAITTTGFPIDRYRTTELMGFDGLQCNSFGAIAATDYVCETAGAVATCMVTLGKFVQDLLQWCTVEFGYLSLSDSVVQVSSIMPQKRNPVALEHSRILASRSLGAAQALFTAMHNTPFGDIVDSEDDLQPLLFGMCEVALRPLQLVPSVLRDATVDVARMRSRAGTSFLTVTELADQLVRQAGLTFHDAHQIVSAAVKKNRADDRHERIVADVQQIAHELLGKPLAMTHEQLLQSLDPDHFVAVRSIPGGPALPAIDAQIAALGATVSASCSWRSERENRLTQAEEKRQSAAEALLV